MCLFKFLRGELCRQKQVEVFGRESVTLERISRKSLWIKASSGVEKKPVIFQKVCR